MKKINKKILMYFSISIFILSLIFLLVYQYKTGLSYKILNNSKKSSQEESSSKETEDNDKETSKSLDISEGEIQENITAKETDKEATSPSTTSSNWWEYPNEILETTKNGNIYILG